MHSYWLDPDIDTIEASPKLPAYIKRLEWICLQQNIIVIKFYLRLETGN